MFDRAGEGRGEAENSVMAEGQTCERRMSTSEEDDAAAIIEARDDPFGAELVIAFESNFETVCELKYGDVKPYGRFSKRFGW